MVFEAGVWSGALTIALLRAVGERGQVVSFEVREDFAKTAQKNIDRFLGAVPNFTLRIQDVYEGFGQEGQEHATLSPASCFKNLINDPSYKTLIFI